MSLLESRPCRRSATVTEGQNAVQEAPVGHMSQAVQPEIEADEANSVVALPALAVSRLGAPMNIRDTATLLGGSTWTIRQRLIPLGLPYFQASPAGKLIFYREQVVRWMERHQRTTALTVVDKA